MLNIFKKLHDKKGKAFIDIVAMVLATTMILVFGITVGGTIYRKTQLDSAANEIKRMVEIDGKYESEEEQKAENIMQKSNINGTISCSASGEIPQDSEFTITLSENSYIGVGNIGEITIPLTGTSVGHGEVYWKE